jgi:hypothetical protein
LAQNYFVVKKGLSVNAVSPSVTVHIAANDAMLIPVGTTAQRPTGADGYIRYNYSNTALEYYSEGSWKSVVDDTQILKIYDVSNNQIFP